MSESIRRHTNRLSTLPCLLTGSDEPLSHSTPNLGQRIIPTVGDLREVIIIICFFFLEFLKGIGTFFAKSENIFEVCALCNDFRGRGGKNWSVGLWSRSWAVLGSLPVYNRP